MIRVIVVNTLFVKVLHLFEEIVSYQLAQLKNK